jgi:FMN-dependent NADH-azoreductase
MADLLYVQSSPRGAGSQSGTIAASFLDAFRGALPAADVDVLDLWHEPLPPFAGDHVEAKMTVIAGAELAGRVRTAWDEILSVVQRLLETDTYLFAVPMWNHNVPWVLKRFIDTVTQPGVTFGFDGVGGYSGLLRGKRAVVVHASAIWPTFGDHVSAQYVEDWLRFVGVEEVHSVRLGSNLLDDRTPAARDAARERAAELGRQLAASAAAARPPALRALRGGR